MATKICESNPRRICQRPLEEVKNDWYKTTHFNTTELWKKHPRLRRHMKNIKKDKPPTVIAFCKAYKVGCRLLLKEVQDPDNKAFLEGQIERLDEIIDAGSRPFQTPFLKCYQKDPWFRALVDGLDGDDDE